jgi:hypothetical protein
MTAIFAPAISRAQREGWSSSDIKSLCKVIAIVGTVVFMLGANAETLELLEREADKLLEEEVVGAAT